MDNTTVHPLCASLAHMIDLHLWRGAPQNLDEDRPIQILVNHGYVVGFCPDRLQPAWSAYRVAYADKDVDYDRPLLYYDDLRLDEKYRIGKNTFGKIGGIPLNVGHMTPNEVINRQFGRLAQMETFMMSNMSPQYASLNQGVWLKLEDAIRNIEDKPKVKDHVWIIVGPIFGDESPSIKRGPNQYVPVPDSYFCIAIDPHSYPFNTPSTVKLDCYIIPQGAPRNTFPQDYPSTLDEIEQKTNLKFFKGYGRQLPLGMLAQEGVPIQSRLEKSLKKLRLDQLNQQTEFETAREQSKSIDELIDVLKSEAAEIQVLDRELTIEEKSKLDTIQHTISFLIQAQSFAGEPKGKSVKPVNFITYNVVEDMGDKLKKNARTACNFWNRFIQPKYSIVIRLGTFTQFGNTIARAYMPYEKDGVRYGKVEFNTRFLIRYSDEEIAGTIIHEIGHTLGIGWDEWADMFDRATGIFKEDAVNKLDDLKFMEVELEGGPGTALAHWDEDRFDKELMTGYKDSGEYVLPVTINVMAVLGHEVIERLDGQKDLAILLQESSNMVFSRQDEVRKINLDYYEETDLMETIPHES